MLHIAAHSSCPGDSDLAVVSECPGIDLSILTGSLPYTFACFARLEMCNIPYKYTALLSQLSADCRADQGCQKEQCS